MADFVDRVTLHAMGGNGGNGVASIKREKFKPLAGPDGGDGGNGGSVILEVSEQETTLLNYHRSPHRRADNGTPGMGDFRQGKTGADIILPVPEGTVVKSMSGELLADLTGAGARYVVAEGGRGGAPERSACEHEERQVNGERLDDAHDKGCAEPPEPSHRVSPSYAIRRLVSGSGEMTTRGGHGRTARGVAPAVPSDLQRQAERC